MGQWPPPQNNYPSQGQGGQGHEDAYQSGFDQGRQSSPSQGDLSSDSAYFKGYHDGVEAAKSQQGVSQDPVTGPMNTGPYSSDPWVTANPQAYENYMKRQQREANFKFYQKVGGAILIGILAVICLVSFLKTGINPDIPTP